MSPQDGPEVIHLTAEERARNAYDAANLQRALENLHRDGLLVLKGVVDIAHVDHLRSVMSDETQAIMADSRRAGKYNQGVSSNILQMPPLSRRDCLYDDVWFNAYVVQIANA